MKICMMVTNSLKKDPRVQREAASAHAAGFDVTVLGCYDSNYDEAFLKELPYKTWIYNLNPKYRGSLKSNVKKFLRMYLPIYNLYKKCRELKPDVIHANDFDTLPAAFIASLFTKSRVVYDSHEIYSGMPQLVSRKLIKKAIQVIEKFIVRRIFAVVSVSNAAAEVLKNMYNIKKPYVVTNCSFKFDEKQLCGKNEGFEVVYQGILNKFRGYEEFVQAAEYTDGVRCVIRGYGKLEDELKNMVREKNLGDKVIFAPPVEIKELIPYASKSHVGVVLTVPVSENFKYTVSNKIFEYIQARIPVILSDVPEHRYINEKYQIGIIIDEVTPKNIANAVNKLYNDKELYDLLKRNVEKAAQALCWENEVKTLLDLYAFTGVAANESH